MSEQKGTMTHPDDGDLAEFRAGLISGRRGARISAHLGACGHCADRCDRLAELTALLTAVPAPAMPDAVSQRLDSVLAAEAARRNDPERAGGDSAPGRASSPPPRRPRGFRPLTLRVLAPAAAVLVLAAGGYGISRAVGGGSAGMASAGSEAAPAASAAARPLTSVRPGAASRHGTPAVAAPLSYPVVTSTVDYQRGTLAQQVTRELARHTRGLAGPQEPASTAVKGCVLLVTSHAVPGTLVLVETARFEGQPALAIVAASGHHDVVWVTTPACSAGHGYILATTPLPGTSAP